MNNTRLTGQRRRRRRRRRAAQPCNRVAEQRDGHGQQRRHRRRHREREPAGDPRPRGDASGADAHDEQRQGDGEHGGGRGRWDRAVLAVRADHGTQHAGERQQPEQRRLRRRLRRHRLVHGGVQPGQREPADRVERKRLGEGDVGHADERDDRRHRLQRPDHRHDRGPHSLLRDASGERGCRDDGAAVRRLPDRGDVRRLLPHPRHDGRAATTRRSSARTAARRRARGLRSSPASSPGSRISTSTRRCFRAARFAASWLNPDRPRPIDPSDKRESRCRPAAGTGSAIHARRRPPEPQVEPALRSAAFAAGS